MALRKVHPSPFVVREFDDALRKAVKIEAAVRGVTLGKMLSIIVEEWLLANASVPYEPADNPDSPSQT